METTQYALIQLFADGGFMMFPLLLASLVATGVIIAKAYILWAARRDTKRILGEVETLGREGKIGEAVETAERTPGPVAAILLAGLRRLQERRAGRDLEQAMNTTGTIELGFLERGLVVLATVATVAPLLGFLGTVWGMIAAFGAIELAGQVEASLVASGIKIALITTATGLLIAIPVNVAYNYFVSRIDQLIVDMEEGTAAVLNLLWDLNPTDRGALVAVGTTPGEARAPRRVMPLETQGTVAEDSELRARE